MPKRLHTVLTRLAVVLSLVSCASWAAAQGAPPEEVRKAQALLQGKDYDGAIRILEEFTRKNPTRWGALNMLGGAYQQKGELEKAIEVFQRVTQSPQLKPQALYSLAVAHALRNDREAAFKYLRLTRETGGFDMEQALTDDNLKALRGDARLARLIPAPEEFVEPFVEKVRVIHEWVGEAKGGQFGWIARRVGDVDGDRVSDFTTSAPTYPVQGQPAGRVYVYSSKTGKLLWAQTGEPGAQLGMGVEAAGDANADGVPDVIAGAPGAGKAFVYSGRDGKLLLTLGRGDRDEAFGGSVATAGDVNGDGHADLIVGASSGGAAGQGAGRAYVYSGKDGSPLVTLSGEQAGDAYGSAVGGYKGRKNSLLIVGAPGAGPRRSGRVYVYEAPSGKPKFVFDSDETGAAFGGMFLSVVGDTDGDKTPDIYVSDWSNNAKGTSTGRFYVYSGADGKLLQTQTGEAAGEGFGIGVADSGDLDRDGHDDIIVGAWRHSSAAEAGGRVYVFSGKDGKLLQAITCRIPGDTFGFDTTNVGDVDGDGRPDFLLTSAWSGIKGFRSGRVFIVSGSAMK